MNLNSDRSNIIWVLTSGSLSLFAGLLIGFFLPKYVSIDTYAGYRTYTLYAGYVGFFHFGFINGIYLQYGGTDYEKLPICDFTVYTYSLMILQILVQVAGVVFMLLTSGKTLFSLPMFYVIFNIFPINLNCYYSMVNQFGKRFRTDSIVRVCSIFLNMGLLLFLLLNGQDRYQDYLKAITLGNFGIFLLSFCTNRRLTRGRFDISEKCWKEILGFVRRGFFIMISEYMGLIILGIDSFLVNFYFTSYDYSMYAFAVSVIAFVLQILNLVARLIYPYLRRMGRDDYGRIYRKLSSAVFLASLILLLGIFLLDYLIPWIIPKYGDSIRIMDILGISAVLRGILDLVCGNYFKALDMEREYAKNNLFAVVLGVGTDLVALIVWRSTGAIAYASVLSFYIWYLVTDHLLKKRMQIKKDPIPLEVTVMVCLYLICINVRRGVGFVAYMVALCILLVRYIQGNIKKKETLRT